MRVELTLAKGVGESATTGRSVLVETDVRSRGSGRGVDGATSHGHGAPAGWPQQHEWVPVVGCVEQPELADTAERSDAASSLGARMPEKIKAMATRIETSGRILRDILASANAPCHC